MELRPGKHSGVLVYLVDNNTKRVCLARKKKKIGKGLRNGYGGSVEPGESVFGAALRELNEEARVTTPVNNLIQVGTVIFHNTLTDSGECIVNVTVFTVGNWFGEPTETEEMGAPEWFPFARLPFDEMMPGDKEFLPAALCQGCTPFLVKVYYGPGQKKLVKPTEHGVLPKEMEV